MIGAPCHPYSTQRSDRYASKSVESHAEYNVTFKDTLDMISMHTPKLVVSEQVQGFDKPIEAGGRRTPYAMHLGKSTRGRTGWAKNIVPQVSIE